MVKEGLPEGGIVAFFPPTGSCSFYIVAEKAVFYRDGKEISATGDIAVKALEEAYMAQLKSHTSFRLLKQLRRTISNLTAIQFNHITEGSKRLDVILLKGDYWYVIAYGADLITYDKFLYDVRQMIDSFRFIS